jgi:hypothetical protein
MGSLHFILQPTSIVILSNAKNPSTPLCHVQDRSTGEALRRAKGDIAIASISYDLIEKLQCFILTSGFFSSPSAFIPWTLS